MKALRIFGVLFVNRSWKYRSPDNRWQRETGARIRHSWGMVHLSRAGIQALVSRSARHSQ